MTSFHEGKFSKGLFTFALLTYTSDRVEVEYKWLLIPDPADYHLPKPSPSAIPMPRSRKDKASLNTSKRQADDNPRAEDPFVTGHTWAEFKNESIAPNPYQVKIDFSKENQIWFYLGKTSTEARAQYTENPRNKRHNTKGNFLDTIPKPIISAPRQSYAASYPSNAKNSTPTPIRPPTRPALPTSSGSSNFNRPEKPYVYKPRNVEDSYRVDPQAYRSQQSFLQRSAPQPYSFGTDPRWQTSTQQSTQPARQASSTTPFKANANSSGHLPQISQVSALAQYRNLQNTLATPSHYSSTAGYTSTGNNTSAQYTAASQFFSRTHNPPAVQHTPTPQPPTQRVTQHVPHHTPQHATQHNSTQYTQAPEQSSPVQQAPKDQYNAPTQYRPTQPVATPSKPNNPFGNRPQPERPSNVFAKYYYLQKEHNRSPLDYKSPYRPGGGFMNGYQGDHMEYMKATLFAGKRPSVSTPHSNTTPSYSNISSSYSGTSQKPSPSYNSSQSPSYGASPATAYTASPSMKPPINTSGVPVIVQPKPWEKKKDAPKVHPAIRREFASILNHQNNPSPQPASTQPRSSVLQPPPLYDRPPYPSTSYASQPYSAPQRNYTASLTPQNQSAPQPAYNKPVSLSASHPQQYSKPATEVQPRTQQASPVAYVSSYQSSSKVQPANSTSAGFVTGQSKQQSPTVYQNPLNSYQTSGHAQTGFSMPKSALPNPLNQQSQGAYTASPVSNQAYGNTQYATGVPTNHSQLNYSQANYAATLKNYEQSTPKVHASPAILSPLTNLQQLPAKNAPTSVLHPAVVQAQATAFSRPTPPQTTTPILPPPPKYSLQRQPEVQKPVYPHQQNFQKSSTQMTPSESNSSSFEPADVPPDSCSIVEKMLQNLKKAQPTSST